MNKIKNSKYKNTAILFELLIRQVTSDTIAGVDSPAIDILRKYYSKTELTKEFKLYQSLIDTKNLSENKANIVIDNILNLSKKLNRTLIKNNKYNLIKEIKDNYDINAFVKHKIDNYPQYAAIYNLIESHNSKDFFEPTKLIENRNTLLEHMSKSKETINSDIYEEYTKLDTDIRILAYRKLLEKFNTKYSNLTDKQKQILKEYINNIDNNLSLREFVNSNYKNIKSELSKLSNKVHNKISSIKLTEVINLLKPLEKTENVRDENVVSLLQYYQLIEELKNIK